MNPVGFNKDCLAKIFFYVDIRTLGRLAQVCQIWNEISSSDGVWSQRLLYATPTPFKEHTVWKIWAAISELKQIKKMPEELPAYSSEEVPSCVSEYKEWEKRWTRCEKYGTSTSPIKSDLSQIKDSMQVMALFGKICDVFYICVLFSKIGFTSLEDAEKLALKTENTFHNPYPFKILEEKYRELGQDAKADQMKEKQLKY
jgi:hypothetical protein